MVMKLKTAILLCVMLSVAGCASHYFRATDASGKVYIVRSEWNGVSQDLVTKEFVSFQNTTSFKSLSKTEAEAEAEKLKAAK